MRRRLEIDGETSTFEADTADLDGLAALPGRVAEELGGAVEILVTNTGGPPAGGALDRSTDEWEGAYRELVLAPRALIEAVLPGMRERGWGRIVNVGSSSTIEAIPHLALSNTHRMAAIGYFKTLCARGRRRRRDDQHRGDGEDRDGPDRRPCRARWKRPARWPSRHAGRAPWNAGGVRRPGGVPVLGARRLRDGDDHPDRRRISARDLATLSPRRAVRSRRAGRSRARPLRLGVARCPRAASRRLSARPVHRPSSRDANAEVGLLVDLRGGEDDGAAGVRVVRRKLVVRVLDDLTVPVDPRHERLPVAVGDVGVDAVLPRSDRVIVPCDETGAGGRRGGLV